MGNFRTVFRSRAPPDDPRIEDLRKWCRIFAGKGLSPKVDGGASAFNLSFRVGAGFIITASGLARTADLEKGCFVRVVSFDAEGMAALAEGIREPPPDTPAHSLIYFMRPEISAVFHGHDPLAVTGTESLEEIKRAVFAGNCLRMKGHGFFALGRTMDEAGLAALEMRERAERFG